jgi:nitrite reductase (NADH) large subunit
MTRRRVVVVGNGMVGHKVVEVLIDRGATTDWDIVVFGEEGRLAYDRVGLSSFFSGTTAEELSLVAPGSYDNIELHLGDSVMSIDKDAAKVMSAGGTVVEYDALVLATGSYPFVPPVPGRDLPGCFVYRTLDDLEMIRDYAAGRRVGAVVGGGLLGLEAANALHHLGLDTHVVEFAPPPHAPPGRRWGKRGAAVSHRGTGRRCAYVDADGRARGRG